MSVVGLDQSQNSLTNIIGIFGDLGSNLNLLTKETPDVEAEPLSMVINSIEDLEETFQLFQKETQEEPNNELIQGIDEAVKGLTSEMSKQLSMEEMTEEMGEPEIANSFRNGIGRSFLEKIQEVSENGEEIRESRSSAVHSLGKLIGSSVVGLESGDEDSKLTYIDVLILLLFILGIFFVFFVFIVLVSLCWRKIFRPRQSWKDLSETDSSVSWVSINTTTTEDTPVKPASQPQHVSTVKTVLQTDILAPISEQKILMVPGEFVLDRGTQWCRTEISPSIIV